MVTDLFDQAIVLLLHVVLEDNAADDDGDGCRELPDEAECAGGCGDVAPWDRGLESDEGGLEVRTDSDAGNDSVLTVSYCDQGKRDLRWQLTGKG